ncbi:hypothetical protein RHSIM_Rhsim11G0169700 [Rhododendron simsii]|uniref:Fe2OG dioxygenase domain-containing protein n=1 Tax=Rhododendron simsii TaxID=118357 RepID=A0A834G5Z3_RHOSS|nr:hypothetical protein RHSIM_Rhsim11G0169700 [Rhododendron simsii]
MGEVDESFIQAVEHRPKLAITEAEGIPLINLSVFNSHDLPSNPSSIETLVEEIRDACKNWGFFQVINHGVPLEKREKLELASRKFFAQSTKEKLKVRRDEVNPQGYYDSEVTKNVRDWKEVFDMTVKNPTVIPASHEDGDNGLKEVVNRWPEYPSELREAFEEYAEEMEKLAHKLLELISLSLGLKANQLSGFFNDHTSFTRLNHYPPCPIPHLALGVTRHKDAGAITILAQDDVGGLQVKRKTDGEWIRVKPTPQAYIVNVGDIIQVWSNDRYESVEHRVKVNSEKERFSIPFFFNPDHNVMVEPLEELITEQGPVKYQAYNWGKFFATKKRSNYKKLDVWSNDKYKSVEHKVMVNSEREREACEEYAEEMEKLAHKLLELISLSLGLKANRLSGFFNDHTSFSKLVHYPSCPIPHLALGISQHKDAGALTILAQDNVGGLQVWSNDRYESVEHRVMVNSEKERFSMPFFVNPDHNVMVEPLEELITEQNPAKYRAYNWGEALCNQKAKYFQDA